MGNSNSSSGNGAIDKKDISKRDSKLNINNNLNEGSKESVPGRVLDGGMIRSESGADIQDRSTTQLIPIEKLAKILLKRSEDEAGVHGIAGEIFVKYLFPQYPELGYRLYKYLHVQSQARTNHMGIVAFRQQVERFLSLLDDSIILETHLKIFSIRASNNNAGTGGAIILDGSDVKKIDINLLLNVCYKLAMENYVTDMDKCLYLERTISSVIQSCFFGKDSLSSSYISRWLDANCPRLISPIHKYCVHTLTTKYRELDGSMKSNANSGVPSSGEGVSSDTDSGQQRATTINPLFDLATPILEKGITFGGGGTSSTTASSDDANIIVDRKLLDDVSTETLLPVSQAWLLAASLPLIYSKSDIQKGLLTKLRSAVPSHWTQLYNSQEHGVGANRFLHHVLAYRGPTLILLASNEDALYCIASTTEWRETHLYTGSPESCVLQLLPKFIFVEKGEKMLYLNTRIRGYPKGLRAGRDPRKPIIAVDEDFEKIEYKGISTKLKTIEVWGCGDSQSREVQLNIKKREIKEAERQRTVKLTAADWMDHPDRYLLELSGRPQYNSS